MQTLTPEEVKKAISDDRKVERLAGARAMPLPFDDVVITVKETGAPAFKKTHAIFTVFQSDPTPGTPSESYITFACQFTSLGWKTTGPNFVVVTIYGPNDGFLADYEYSWSAACGDLNKPFNIKWPTPSGFIDVVTAIGLQTKPPGGNIIRPC